MASFSDFTRDKTRPDTGRPAGGRALIIEDEALISVHLQDLLGSLGFTSFDFAITEAQAVAACRANRPDIITADIRLAEGTGIGAVDAIRRGGGDMPVVFVSGNVRDLAGRGDVACEKPISDRSFMRAVHEALRRSAAAGPGGLH